MAVPWSWRAVTYLFLTILVVSAIFLWNLSYARVETVAGTVSLDRGIATIVPSRHGVITDLRARDGDFVRAGDVLLYIRSEEDMAAGDPASARILEALREQDLRLARQSDLLRHSSASGQERLRAQIVGLHDEIASLDQQIAGQERLVEVAETEFGDAQDVAKKGFISRRDLNARETAVLARKQQLAQLRQLRAAKQAQYEQTQREIPQATASIGAQAAAVQSSRAELLQRLAQVQATRGYSVKAPIDGIVTAVTARPGQPAEIGQTLMMLIPSGARQRAELYVPSQASGFLAIGQEVRLAVDAFPYQRFGTVTGRIVQISSAPVPRQNESGNTIPVYLVVAEIDAPVVRAFGRQQPLLLGMTLTARIVTERRSLIEWLFEPLFAVAQR